MYKGLPANLEKTLLDTRLYDIHKTGAEASDFGMDNTAELLENGFGLYSTRNVKAFGPIKIHFYRIALTRQGSADFGIGLEKCTVQRDSALFGFPGQIFTLHDFRQDFFAYYLLFSEGFLADALLRLGRNQGLPFFTHAGRHCFRLDSATAEQIEAMILRIDEELGQRKPGCAEMIRLYVQQMLVLCQRCYGEIGAEPVFSPRQALHHSFLRAVDEHFLSVRKVAAYAGMLHVSPDHLNRAIKACADKTAHELIDERVLMEAKAYLRQTELTVAEIGALLEFGDPSHFSRFFKKYCGQTPAEFRSQS